MKFNVRTKEQAYQEIKSLVENFDRNKSTYLGTKYDEAITNLKEALELYFKDNKEVNIPLPTYLTQIEVTI